jgi:periplasmic protein TonB
MDNNLNNIPDFDDLLFEKRNKNYGAFQLRKKYNSIVILGTLIVSLIASISLIIQLVLTTDKSHLIAGGNKFVQVHMDNLELPREELFIPSSPPPPDADKIRDLVKYTPPIVVDSLPLNEKPTATNEEILARPSDLKVDLTGTGVGNDLIAGQGGTEMEEPFIMVEIMPSFKGGDINKFRDWVSRRTNYPKSAIDKKIQGRVLLTFIVESDGTVSNVTVLKGVDPLIDNEAIKAIEASPKWNPGLQRGKPVRVRYQIPLTFSI